MKTVMATMLELEDGSIAVSVAYKRNGKLYAIQDVLCPEAVAFYEVGTDDLDAQIGNAAKMAMFYILRNIKRDHAHQTDPS